MKRPLFLQQLLVLLLAFSSFSLFLHLFSKPKSYPQNPNPKTELFKHPPLKVYIANLPCKFNYGLLELFYSLDGPDSRLGWNPDTNRFSSFLHRLIKTHFSTPPYPEHPLIKPHAAEYYMLNDLQKVKYPKQASSAIRVYNSDEADVILVPFFASLSAEMELGWGQKGKFMKRDEEKNNDYKRQREVVDRIKASQAWQRSGGRDHVFIMSDPIAMWHVRSEIAPAVLVVEDFGGWYKTDLRISTNNDMSENSNIIQHTEVSLLKDVIVPYHHLIPTLDISDNQQRHVLYFKGTKRRHRGGFVREKLWNLLANESGVVMEEGSLNSTSIQDSTRGMRDSEFCLHPAGDTPTSCRLFDAFASLCIPVIVSDQIELPFEGILDYTNVAVFVSMKNALTPNWLLNHLRAFSEEQKETFRVNIARFQSFFEYDNGDAVNQIWEMIHEKVPMIRQAIVMESRTTNEMQRRNLTCHCT